MSENTLWRGSAALRLRLVSGLVLFAFAAAHFTDHALGLVSLEAMSAFEAGQSAVTRSLPGGLVLLAALLVHAGLGLWTALRRRTWVIPVWEWVQIATGVAIPVLLLPHVINTRVTAMLFGVHTTYPYELARIWPATIVQQTILLLLVWVHGCVGLHYWLRLTPHYRLVRPVLFAIAVLLPFAALAGVSVQGRMIAALLTDPVREAALKARTAWPDAAQSAVIETLRENAQFAYVAIVACTVAAAAAGVALMLRRRRIPVRYVGGAVVRTEPGATLLEVSRRYNLPHVSVCGGRGRCSTCRVLVLNNGAGVTPASDAERRTLTAIGAGPHVRLACQAQAVGEVTILPLLKSAEGFPQASRSPASAGDGVERELAVLFVDLRGFTALTERKLPFDVIFILNQFFAAVGQPVHDYGGWIANYAGDGLMALFDDPSGLAGACRSALLATAQIDVAMRSLSDNLMEETRAPIRVAMGLHAGTHVMGRVGFGATQPASVIGLAVNVASRLELLAKEHGVQLAVSRVVADHGRLDTRGLTTETIEVRGLSAPLGVLFVDRAGSLLDRLDKAGALDTMALS